MLKDDNECLQVLPPVRITVEVIQNGVLKPQISFSIQYHKLSSTLSCPAIGVLSENCGTVSPADIITGSDRTIPHRERRSHVQSHTASNAANRVDGNERARSWEGEMASQTELNDGGRDKLGR